MSNARDKANIPALNFSSTGIDDNATSTAITINSSEQLAIGTTSFDQDAKLVVAGSGTGGSNPSTISTNTIATFRRTGGLSHTANISIIGGSTGNSIINFGDRDDEDVGRLIYDHTNNYFSFNTNTTEGMRLTSTGLGIGTSSPSEKLHIENGDVMIKETGTSDPLLKFSTTSQEWIFRIDNSDSDKFQMRDATGGNTVFTADTSGNLGIGTSSPGSILTVSKSGDTVKADFTNGVNANFRILTSGSVAQIGPSTASDLVFLSSNVEKMRIDSSGRLGLGTTSPGSYKLSLVDSGSCLVKFRGGSGSGTYQQFEVNNGASTIGYLGDGASLISGGSQTDMCLRGTNNIKFAIGATQEATINSSGLTVHGALSKSSGSFKIDHPLENKKDTHHLVHSFVEAPQADNIYRGKIDLINGTATVNIDTVAGMSEGTFVLLNTNIQCFTSNETGWIAVKGSVSGNTLTITAQDNTCTDTISWMVIGERQDQHMYDTDWTDENGKVIVEPLKETEQQP